MTWRSRPLFFGVAALVVLLDQVTKYIVSTGMPLYSSIPVLDGLFSITYVRNPGAAFGFLATAPVYFRAVFFITVTVAAIILILYYLRRYGFGDWKLTLALSLIMGGAVGNLVDRIRSGEVVDFFDVYIGPYHWPAFNVADSAISVGAVLLLIGMVGKTREGR
ncbi:MAG TPA: signal peptidase II [Syntrophales bacterium]|nr:signal peptidase II [Syntrophales bacterium]HRT70530.1 signal peptidase II [Syntrophales bacterium]